MFIIYDFLTIFRNNYQVSKNTHNNDCFQRCNNLHYILQFSLSPPRSMAMMPKIKTRKQGRDEMKKYDYNISCKNISKVSIFLRKKVSMIKCPFERISSLSLQSSNFNQNRIKISRICKFLIKLIIGKRNGTINDFDRGNWITGRYSSGINAGYS